MYAAEALFGLEAYRLTTGAAARDHGEPFVNDSCTSTVEVEKNFRLKTVLFSLRQECPDGD